ncbi:MAG: zinc-ribbon domain containing protein [Patescibacteria group bacterium]
MPKCKHCHQDFTIDQQEQQFYQEIKVPTPTFCPDCRQQRRLAWTNELTLYNRKCDLTGKNVISMFNPDVPFPVYDFHEWWGDKWDAGKYGADYNPEQSFFDQFIALKNRVPHPSLEANITLQNSDYTNYCGYAVNCFLIFDSAYTENCYYGYTLIRCKEAVDCMKSHGCEYCYYCSDCTSCFKLKYSQDCNKCSESYFLKYCSGCNSCFGCINLRNKSYCWLNKQLTPEEYNKRLAMVDFGSREVVAKVKSKFDEFCLRYPHIAIHGIKNEDCSGDYLNSTFQTVASYDCRDVQNCRYSYSISLGGKDVYDVFQFGGESQILYESVVSGYKNYNCKFCYQSYTSGQNLEYCFNCLGSKNCFGCVGLRKREFCILNKQYSEAEYNRLKEEIIVKMTATGEYGEFLPASMSHHGYNETSAMFYYPLTKEQATAQGFWWYDKKVTAPAVSKIVPDNIKEVPDAITSDVFVCSCGKSYRVTTQELKFYRAFSIPVPEKCYICRHVDRLFQRNPQHLWERSCSKCGRAMQTTYAPERPEIVYCKKCFQDDVY